MKTFIDPDWPAPPGIRALSTTRLGGESRAPWNSFNLGDHVGDDPASVTANRARLAAKLPAGTQLQWLRQVHGTRVIEAGAAATPEADASWTASLGHACAVMTADCLPVLFCDRAGTTVAAAHAGWRGLCAGVLEATVAAMPVDSGELLAWLGPAIGAEAFEVGAEVRDAFVAVSAAADACFHPADRAEHFLADIYQLARQRLQACGVNQVHGGGACTCTDETRFFSYRRDGQTGRMATVICIAPG